MRRSLRLALLFLFLLTTTAVSQPLAAGVGIYIPAHSGSGEWDFEDSGCDWSGCYDFDYEVDVDTFNIGFGFVMDTAPADDRVFNYRLGIGIEKFEADLPWSTELDMTGLAINNTFGFKLFRSREGLVRVWLGPRIRVGLYYGNYDGDWFDDEADAFGAEFGVAPVLGANFNIGRVITLAGSIGYNLSYYYVAADDYDERFRPVSWEDTEMYGALGSRYASLAIMFRGGSDVR
jgi:hypothetical protein